MEDVQNIMNKMENLDKEVAINGQTEQDLASLVTTADAKVGATPSTCGQNNNNVINISCTAVVPNNIGTVVEGKTTKFIFNPNCLDVSIEPCPTNSIPVCDDLTINIPVYKIKVVGCIPFAFSATDALEDTTCGNFPDTAGSTKTTDICCHGSVCVNNSICCKIAGPDDLAAKALAAIIQAEILSLKLKCTGTKKITISGAPTYALVKCTCTPAGGGTCSCDKGYNGSPDEQYVVFSAQLTLPTC